MLDLASGRLDNAGPLNNRNTLDTDQGIKGRSLTLNTGQMATSSARSDATAGFQA